MKTIDELIEALEFGWGRAEEPTWVACSIMADDDGLALLNDLKDARNARNIRDNPNNKGEEGERQNVRG